MVKKIFKTIAKKNNMLYNIPVRANEHVKFENIIKLFKFC